MSYKIFKINKTSNYLLGIIAGLKQIFQTPVISAIIILVMTLALFLTMTFSLLWHNKDTVQNRWNESAEIALYLKKNVTLETTTNLVTKLQQNPIIARVTLIQPDEGIKAFAERTALNMLLSSFKENPLPTVIIIYPKIKVLSQRVALEFIQTLKNQTAIETVKADMDWLEQSHNWLNLWDTLSLIFILALTINTLLVISGISYLVTNIFITNSNSSKTTLPYQFAWYSLISSTIALLLVKLLAVALQNQNIPTQELPSSFIIFILVGGLLLSFLSSMLATFKDN